MKKMPLPIDDAIPAIVAQLHKHHALALSAAPGTGKTTRLPPALLAGTHKQVWVLEPRRIAAIAASQRIADENGWSLGREVGYQVRFDNKSSRDTRLLFLTEALLLRKLLQDPELKDVGCVVLDEFHERSLHVDLALGALRELQQLARPDLRIVVMSATLHTDPVASFLGDCPVSVVPGEIFPLTTHHESKAQLLRTGPEFTERLAKLVIRAAQENPAGDILCFLPGRGEIERLRTELGSWADARNAALFPLHGQLSLAEQRAALAPLPGRRKILLATNVAESSLTVEGVRIVVDSGLARVAQLHPRTGFESLELSRISKASATQRAGRAARRGPGVVYRAWSPHDERSMKDFEVAEILRSDLSETVLLLAALGVSHPESFSWFEAPPEKSLAQARSFLEALGALTPQGELTALGKELRLLPLHPRLAKLLLRGKARGLTEFAAELAALLAEGGSRLPAWRYEAENDLWIRREDWRQNRHHPKNQAIARAADQLKSLVRDDAPAAPNAHLETEMPALLLEVYADRLCRRRRAHEPQAKMTGGRGVKLQPDSSVKASEYFLALELGEGRENSETLVYQAVGIPTALVEEKILPLSEPSIELQWDDEKNRFWAIESRAWRGLPIGREHRRPAEPGEIEGRLAQVALNRWDQLLARNEALAAWVGRLRFLHGRDEAFPLLTEAQKLEALSLACYGENSLPPVEQKELVPYFEGLLSEEHRQALARECPASWLVPSGNRFRIQYSEEQGPLVEVRLQELFGLADAPKIAGQPLTLVLLAPNFRPVQVTRDLPSFWKNGYPEVRKEMRTRYPRHSWPDDPLTAPPQSKGRARGAL